MGAPPATLPVLTALLAATLAAGCGLDGDRLDEPPSGASDPGYGPGTPGSGGGTKAPQACQDFTLETDGAASQADVIFAVDTSGSMAEEIGFVQAQLNAFSVQLGADDVDLRVIMLGDVCVAPPLGTGSCPSDQQLPDYVHPASVVASTDALSVIVDQYGSYGFHLRPDARKHVVIVTDENAAPPNLHDAPTFVSTFTGLHPASLSGFTAHAVYCFAAGGACCSEGSVYRDLVNLTGGLHGDLASQDFAPIFEVLAQKIVADGAPLPCVIAIPKPPDGKVLDTASVTVTFVDQDYDVHVLPAVADMASCALSSGGWAFDDDETPSAIHLCPSSCDQVSEAVMGQLQIGLSCDELPSPN